MEKTSKLQVTNAKNPEFLTRMMIESVEKCYTDNLFLPTLCLICCYIDGLGNGKPVDYKRNLETHFPDLCKEMSAESFYQKYRHGVVHEFAMKPDFGIWRDSMMKSKYIDEKEHGKKLITVLNVDRLTKDFLRWARSERRKHGYSSI